jgi:hypothetical protein
MGKKEMCKEIMTRLLGPNAAAQVDEMDEDNCISKCKEIVSQFLGDSVADREFNSV